MSMLPNEVIPICEGRPGQVFDFVLKNGAALITNFSRLDKDVWASNSVEVYLGEKKERIVATSIDHLKSLLNKFLSATLEILSRHTPFVPQDPFTHPDFSNLKRDLLIEQLIFDILFDKYLNESELMTRNSYSNYIGRLLCDDSIERINICHAVNERLKRGMAIHHDRTAYSKLSEQIKLFGVDPDKFAEYYSPHMRENPRRKKPKFIWSLLYYNFCLDLTARQYRRQLTRDSRNYSYKESFSDLQSYNNFVTKLLPAEFESHEKYFRMSMDYYYLESYKRVDFIFKLIAALGPDEIDAIDRNHSLVSRFAPCILVPFIQDNELHFMLQYNYYRPMFIIEEVLLKEMLLKMEKLVEAFPQEIQMVKDNCKKYYESELKKHQYARAKAYELFKFHGMFQSNDYIEIKKFLCKCYDMRSYHQANAFWNLIQDNNWDQMDNITKQPLTEQIRQFLSINDAFFWKSSDRNYTKPETNN